jgi:hypothetical protein
MLICLKNRRRGRSRTECWGEYFGSKKEGVTGGEENCVMRSFVVVTLIWRLDGSVGLVANYELGELIFGIRCLALGREFLHSVWNVSVTNVQSNLRVRGAVPPFCHMFY